MKTFILFLFCSLTCIVIFATTVATKSKDNSNLAIKKTYSVGIQQFSSNLSLFKLKSVKNFNSTNSSSINNYMVYNNGNSYYTVPLNYNFKTNFNKLSKIKLAVSLNK